MSEQKKVDNSEKKSKITVHKKIANVSWDREAFEVRKASSALWGDELCTRCALLILPLRDLQICLRGPLSFLAFGFAAYSSKRLFSNLRN